MKGNGTGWQWGGAVREEGEWLVLDRLSLQCLLNLKENAPSKQVHLGMELKIEIRSRSH